MKVIIAGSRTITDWTSVQQAIWNWSSNYKISEVVSGGCPTGVDYIGEALAELHGIPVRKFPADWTKYGKGAGPIRNNEMANYADGLIAVWDGKSKGTKNMIDTMKKLGKPVSIYMVENNDE